MHFSRIIFLVLLYVPSIYAQTVEEKVAQLTALPHRPTVEEIRKVMGDDINLKSMPHLRQYVETYQRGTTLKALASSIANLERIYPGAIWRPLGRDAARFGDFVDSFYQNIGQMGRVKRIDASGVSIRNVSPPHIFRFLETNGFDLANFKNNPPFVIIDRTNYQSADAGHGRDSQSTTYAFSVYNEAQRRGIPLNELVPYFGVVGFGQNEAADFDRQKYYEKISPKPGDGYHPAPSGIARTANAGLENGIQWHNPFGKLFEVEPGKFGALPGRHIQSQNRTNSIYEICAAIYATAQPSFLEAVRANAKQFGYEFPMTTLQVKPTEKLPKVEYSIDKLIEGLQATLAALKPIPAEAAEDRQGSGRYTDNGQALLHWLNRETAPAASFEKLDSMLLVFLKGATEAYDKQLIDARDFRYLIAAVLAETDMSREFLDSFAQHLYASQASLRKIWTEKSEYFLDKNPKRRGGIAVPTNYEKISLNLDMSQCMGSFDWSI